VKQRKRKLSVVQECYSRAAEARRLAGTAATPAEKADLLEIEQRWLAPRPQPKIDQAGAPNRKARPQMRSHSGGLLAIVLNDVLAPPQ
jgi:hypothetical protein